MRDKAMSKLSPWLAHGCLSPRLLYEEVKRYEAERSKNKSTYWITHELLWRDFVRFGSMHAGTSIFKIGGPWAVRTTWQWSANLEIFKAWCDGRTGFPFIDCFMRELSVTGYCNHMGRECAGWFLIGDLGIDWRMGAEWFESVLVDYEPTANWYNWAYRCLPAARRKDAPGQQLQGLELLKWGTQHDPDSTYIKRWIPELSELPATTAREPWRLGLIDRPPGSSSRLRPSPSGSFKVSKGALEMVVGMGFGESEAASALYRAHDDPEAAIALLTGEDGFSDDDQDPDLAEALSLSLQEAGRNTDVISIDDDDDGKQTGTDESRQGFRYGIDYPKPIIQPVSLHGTEEAADEARQAQAKRDQQIRTARSRGNKTRERFSKPDWEVRKQAWPSETPTSAKMGHYIPAAEKESGKSAGKGKGKAEYHNRNGSKDSPYGSESANQRIPENRFHGKRRWSAKAQ
jgi:hypothetical protein